MQKTIRTSRLYGLLIAGVCILLLEIFAAPATRAFLYTGSVQAEKALQTVGFAAVFLRIRCLAVPSQFLNYHTSYCMQAMGRGSSTMLHVLVRELVFYIPIMLLFDRFWGQSGLIFAPLVGETCGAVFALFLLYRIVRQKPAPHSAGEN